MTGPDRIWIDRHGGNWSPVDGGTQDIEYIRRDPAVLAALPEVQAMIAAAYEVAAAMIEDNVRHAKELGREIWPIPDLRTVTSHDATAALARIVRKAEARGMERAAARARVYASNYEQSSDGRNTFILLAEWADAEAAAILARADQIEKDAAK